MSMFRKFPMATSAYPQRSAPKHRWWLPVVPLLVGAGLLALLQFIKLPAEVGYPLFGVAAMIIVGALVFVVPLWWFFASGFSGRTRLIVALMVIGLLVGAFFLIRKVELLPFHRIGLYPRFTFI